MKTIQDEHPCNESLMEYAFKENDASIRTHLDECPSCSRYVKELHSVADALVNVPDAEVPDQIRRKIMATSRRQSHKILIPIQFSVENWHSNPLVVGLGIIGAVVFLYIFFVFVL